MCADFCYQNSGPLLKKKKKITPTFEETMGNISKQRKNIYETRSSAQLVELVNLSIIIKYKAGQNDQFTFKIHNRDSVMA